MTIHSCGGFLIQFCTRILIQFEKGLEGGLKKGLLKGTSEESLRILEGAPSDWPPFTFQASQRVGEPRSNLGSNLG